MNSEGLSYLDVFLLIQLRLFCVNFDAIKTTKIFISNYMELS